MGTDWIDAYRGSAGLSESVAPKASLTATAELHWGGGTDLALSWSESPGTERWVMAPTELASVQRLADAVRFAERRGPPASIRAAHAKFGTALFEMLDGPEHALIHRIEAASAANRGLQLVVRATSANPCSLHQHPALGMAWQLLSLADCARDSCFTVVLQLGPQELVSPRVLRGTGLRILFMALSPREALPELEFEHEEEALLAALAPMAETGRARMDVTEEGTLEQLDAALRVENYQVVHLTGHGLVTSMGPRVLMEDFFGSTRPVSPKDLLQVLERAKAMPELVVLAACESADGRGSVASFAAELVAAGIPNVLGWTRPVRDDHATFAASTLYEQLGAGKTPVEATEIARARLRRREESSPTRTHAWSTLQLVTRSACGFRIDGDGAPFEARAERDDIYEYLGTRMRVLKSGFVGRRRLVQRLLRVILGGEDSRANGSRALAGACLFGMRGVGKSCVTGRAVERAKQVAPKLRVVILHGVVDEHHVLDAFQASLSNGDEDAYAARLLGLADEPVLTRVRRLMDHWREREVAIILDDFEHNLQCCSSGPWLLSADAGKLLELLLPICATGKPKLIVTSTAEFATPGEHGDALAFIPLGSLDTGAVRKLWMRGQTSNELARVSLKTWHELADRLGRNARVLTWAKALCAGRADDTLAAVVASASAAMPSWTPGDEASEEKHAELARLFLRQIAYDRACAAVGHDALVFLKRARVFEAAVPKQAFIAFTDALSVDLDRDLNVLASFGLLEVGDIYGERAYRVSPLVEPRFDMPDAKRWHAAAARAWANLTRATNTGSEDFPIVQAAWEHALQAGEVALAEELGGFLEFQLFRRGLYASGHQLAEQHVRAFPEASFGYRWAGNHGFHAGMPAPTALALYERGHALLLLECGSDQHMAVERSLFRLGTLLSDAQGDLTRALEAHERSLALCMARVQTDEHPNVAASLVQIGAVRAMLGDLPGALRAAEHALTIRVKLEADARDLAEVLHLLSHLFLEYGDLESARAAAERVRALSARIYPFEDHPNVAAEWHCLGRILHAQGDLTGARRAVERSLELKAKLFGTEFHPDVGKSLGELGDILMSLGDFDAARRTVERAIAILDRVCCTQVHPAIGIAYSHLADIFLRVGDLTAARTAVERALDIRFRVFGNEEHPGAAVELVTLGRVLEREGDLAGARTIIERACGIAIRAFGTEEHHDVAVGLSALACVCLNQGDVAAARKAIERSLEIDRRLARTDHPGFAISLQILAAALHREGNLEGAHHAAESALSTWTGTQDADKNPEVANALRTLAQVLADRGDRDGARQAFERAITTDIAARQSEDHLPIAEQLYNLGVFTAASGDDGHALRHLERALAIVARVAGNEHRLFLRTLESLGAVHQRLGNLSAARRCLEQALALWQQALGTDEDANVARALHNLAAALQGQRNLSGAEDALKRALAIFARVLGPGDHLPVADSLYGLACVLAERRDLEGARAAVTRSIAIWTSLLGPEHPDLADARALLADVTRAVTAGARPPAALRPSEQPCPCGSGLGFSACHGALDDQE